MFGVSRLAGILLATALGYVCALPAAPARAQAPGSPRGSAQPAQGAQPSPIAGIRSWGYQLQHVDPAQIAASPFDLVVIDYSRSGDDQGRFKPAEVRQMQRKPDGSRRFVLAYLSIGEAESYRFYWNDSWIEPYRVILENGSAVSAKLSESTPDNKEEVYQQAKKFGADDRIRPLHFPRLSAPSWLGRENENWRTNFHVRYWEKGWQDIVFGSPSAYLERIVSADFDGIYLDRVDAYYAVLDSRPSAKSDMVRFATALSRHAKRLKPGFAIVAQNGEELLLVPKYLDAIDGIAKEDLFYGYPYEGKPNDEYVVKNSLGWLAPARRKNLPVLVVEYTLDKKLVAKLEPMIRGPGYVPYYGIRSLDRLVLPSEVSPAAEQVPASAPSSGTTVPQTAPRR